MFEGDFSFVARGGTRRLPVRSNEGELIMLAL